MEIAAATTSLRVGTNVLNNDFRHPVLLAREAATVDLLTDGRLQLGLGAGHMESEYAEVGLRFDPGATRVERLAECVCQPGMAHFDAREWPTLALVPTVEFDDESVGRSISLSQA
jgi:Luciferase-like monooxygenase